MIYYVCLFADGDQAIRRVGSPAAKSFILYLTFLFSKIDKTTIVSIAGKRDPGLLRGGYGSAFFREASFPVRYFGSLSTHFKISNYLLRKIFLVHLFFFLLFNVKRDDSVVFYHSPETVWIETQMARLKKKRAIIHCCELYGLDFPSARRRRAFSAKENRMLSSFQKAIFITNAYRTKCHCQSILCHGVYLALERSSAPDVNHPKTTIIYTGFLGGEGRGAFTLAHIAEYLPNSFEILVASYGKDEERKLFSELVQSINGLPKPHCFIRDLGFVENESLEKLYINADFGFSLTTYLSDESKHYRFPSKVIRYLSYGLTVFCDDSPYFENSPIADLVVRFPSDATYSQIADLILHTPKRNRSFLRQKMEYISNDLLTGLSKLINQR